jgi:MazG family protein
MADRPEKEDDAIAELQQVMATLRGPAGCPWDKSQDWNTLTAWTLEEAYELADAVASGKTDAIRDELADLMFHVVFYARIGEEQGLFGLQDVARQAVEKLRRRHPHVFRPVNWQSEGKSLEDNWQRIKRQERLDRGEDGMFSGMATNMPALMQALALQRRAASVGFDWPEQEPVFAKVEEETLEVRHAWEAQDANRVEEEIGDLLFSAVNLARHLGVHPEKALLGSIRRFRQRLLWVENELATAGRRMEDAALDELDELWEQAKLALAPHDAQSSGNPSQ